MIRAGRNGEPIRQVFRYRADALGRRVAKEDEFGATVFTWEGLRLLQERRGGQSSTYLYEAESYVPLARIDGEGGIEEHPAAVHAFGPDARAGKRGSVPETNGAWSDGFNAAAAYDGGAGPGPQPAASLPTASIYYFHAQPNGLPEEMSDLQGNLVWQARYRTWGATVQEHWQAFDGTGRPVDAPVAETGQRTQASAAPLPQNLRMQGQYLDRETGLHTNTFRTYDPELGAFTTPDPIGLAGGMNLYRYAPNPVTWIDPWGWECIQNKVAGTAREARVGARLNGKFGAANVLRERYLRDANGKMVRDPMTGEARRVDFVVKGADGKGTAIEVTSKTAEKTNQLRKEKNIRSQGGKYVREPGTKALVEVINISRVIRVE